MHYILEGTIVEITKTEEFTSGFKKRGIVIRTEDRQPQDIKVEFIQDNCGKLDLFKNDELVTVAFTIVSNLYQDKYYTNLRGIAIGEKVMEGDVKKVKSKVKLGGKIEKSEDDLDF
jgi:single-strand DNA-binding protein